MKVLYWTPLFWPDVGGIETISMNALPVLRDRNYDFVALTSHGNRKLPDEEQHNGIQIYRFPFLSALSKGDLRQILKIQRQIADLKQTLKPDLVHIHLGGPISYFHLKTTSAYSAPTLVTLHASFAEYVSGPDTLLGQTLDFADWVVAVSEAVLADIRAVTPAISNRSSVIYNGLKISNALPDSLQFHDPKILCLGRLVHEKGFDLAINAFASLIKRFPQARLIIVGDGPARAHLETESMRLGLTEAIEFTGWRTPEEVLRLISKATVVVVPSRWREPFPMVALEAAQMGRPVVATDVGGLPESVVHQQTGLLVGKEDSIALAKAITFLLDHPDRAMQMGEAGRLRVKTKFSLEQYVDAYDVLYQNFSEPRNRPRIGHTAS